MADDISSSEASRCGVGEMMSNPCCGNLGEVILTVGGGMRGVEVVCEGAALCLGGLRGRCMGLGIRMGALSSLSMSKLARGEGRCDKSNDRRGIGKLSCVCSTGWVLGMNGFEEGIGGLGFNF